MRSEWRIAKLIDVAAKKRWALNGGPFGSKLSRKHYSETGVPVIRGTNLSGASKFSFDDFVYVSDEKADELRANNAHPGDLIFTQRGTIGQVGLIPFDSPIPRFVISQSQMKLTVDPEQADALFLYYFFSAANTVQAIQNLAFAAGVPHINLDILRKFEMPLPPLSVQRRIAGILSAYDELMENSQRRIRLLEAMARALYREWFIEFRFLGYERQRHVASPMGDIPRGWEVAPLSSLVDFAKGRKPAETRKESLPGDVKLLLIDSLHGGEAVFASPAKLVLAEIRDTIMVMDGASSCEVTIGSSGAVGSTLGRFRTIRPNAFSPHALYRFLEVKSEEFKSKNIGAAIPHANRDYILTQPVALPPKDVASSFHAQLEPIQSTIETLKAQIQNLRRTCNLLLPRLLSGRLNLE